MFVSMAASTLIDQADLALWRRIRRQANDLAASVTVRDPAVRSVTSKPTVRAGMHAWSFHERLRGSTCGRILDRLADISGPSMGRAICGADVDLPVGPTRDDNPMAFRDRESR